MSEGVSFQLPFGGQFSRAVDTTPRSTGSAVRHGQSAPLQLNPTTTGGCPTCRATSSGPLSTAAPEEGPGNQTRERDSSGARDRVTRARWAPVLWRVERGEQQVRQRPLRWIALRNDPVVATAGTGATRRVPSTLGRLARCRIQRVHNRGSCPHSRGCGTPQGRVAPGFPAADNRLNRTGPCSRPAGPRARP